MSSDDCFVPRPEKLTEVDTIEIQRWVNAPGVLCLVCAESRPGFWPFMVELELRWFPPETDLNVFFQLATVEFVGYKFAVLLVPDTVRPQVEEIAARWDLRLIRAVPIAYGTGRVVTMAAVKEDKFDGQKLPPALQWFPIQGANVFTMERLSFGGPQKWNDPEQMLLDKIECDRLLAELQKFL